MKTYEANRSTSEISMLNPLQIGDGIELDGKTGGELWVVDRGAYGWKLHAPANCTWVHPTIHDIDGMQEFIAAILEASK